MVTEVDVNSGNYTPESMRMRRRMAEALIQQGMQATPIQSHWQGLARLASAIMGGQQFRALEDREQSQLTGEAAFNAGRFGVTAPPGNTGTGNATAAPTPPVTPPVTPPSTTGGNRRTTSGGTGDMTIPRPLRINNPGAIEYGPFAQQLGATGSDGRYAIFPDVDTGYRAMERLLQTYMGRGQNTVAAIIGGTPSNPDRAWAPRNVDRNSTDAYIRSVAERLGIRPDQVLTPDMIPRLAEAMAHYESGRPVPRGTASAQPPPAAVVPVAQPAPGAPAPAAPVPSAIPGTSVVDPAAGDGAATAETAAALTGDAAMQPPSISAAGITPPLNAPAPPAAPVAPVAAAPAPAAPVPGAPAPAPGGPPAGRMTQPEATAEAYRRMGARAAEVQAGLISPNPRVRAAAVAEITAAIGAVMAEQTPASPLQQAQMEHARAQTEHSRLQDQQLQRNLDRADPATVARNISGGLGRLAAVPAEFGQENLERGIGPLQGASTNETSGGGWVGAIASVLPSAFAKLTSSIQAQAQGGATPTEVRNRINADVEALAATIKPLIRVPGEGTWSDADQARLNSIVGNLATASTQAEYTRALEQVRERLIANFGLNIPPIVAGSTSANPPPRPGQERSWWDLLSGNTPEARDATADAANNQAAIERRRAEALRQAMERRGSFTGGGQ